MTETVAVAYLQPYVVVDSRGHRREWPSVQERLMARLDTSGGPAACWEWQGYRNPKGYGQVGTKHSRVRLAHRVAYEIAAGSFVSSDLAVCHTCDNPPCCNPAHLWVGTFKDNSSDMVRKGRSPRTPNELSGKCKLTNAEVAEIRRRRSAGEQLKLIAKDFGIHPAHASRVARHLRRPLEVRGA